MLITRALPISRIIIQCNYPSFALPSFQSNKLRRNISNYDPGPQIPQHFPQHSPGIPQYFPQQPSPIPQYILHQFPEQPPVQEPKTLEKWGRYAGIIAGLICAAFIGQCVLRNPDQRFVFDFCRGEGLMGNERLHKFLSSVGKKEFRAFLTKINKCSKMNHLGEIQMVLPSGKGEDSGVESSQSQVAQPIESIQNMLEVLVRMVPSYPMHHRREVGFVGYWWVSNGDYCKLAQTASLINSFPDGSILIHRDAYTILGDVDYFAFATAQNIAPLMFHHDTEAFSTECLAIAIASGTYIWSYLTTKSVRKSMSRTIPLVLLLKFGLLNWTSRAAQKEADVVAIKIVGHCGYDFRKGIEALEKLEELQKIEPRRVEAFIPEYLSNKNSLSTRIQVIKGAISKEAAFREEESQIVEVRNKKIKEIQELEATQEAERAKRGLNPLNLNSTSQENRSNNSESNPDPHFQEGENINNDSNFNPSSEEKKNDNDESNSA